MKHLEVFESKLDLQQLKKPSRTQPGKLRGDDFVSKIETDGEFKINGKDVHISQMKDKETNTWEEPEDAVGDITTNQDYDINKADKYFKKSNRYDKVFKDDNDNEITLNQLDKTREFGSSGPGSRTRFFETIQTVFISIQKDFPDLKLTPNNAVRLFKDYINNSNKKWQQKVFSDTPITADMIDEFAHDKDWLYSFVEIPKHIMHYINPIYRYKFYHISYKGSESPYNLIRQKIKEFGAKFEFSKFCPADVYLIPESGMIRNPKTGKYISVNRDFVYQKIARAKNVGDLIKSLNFLFDNKLMISLSMKKVRFGDKFNVVINNEIENDELVDVVFNFRRVYVTQDPMLGISSRIEAMSVYKGRRKLRTMNFDSSNTNRVTNIDGEILGSTSRHGKIILAQILYIISKHGLKLRSKVDDAKSIHEKETSELEEMVQSTYEQVVLLQNDIPISFIGTRGVNATPVGSNISGHKGRLASKIQSLQLIRLLLEIRVGYGQRKFTKVLTDIYKHALSIQIYDRKSQINTPRYFRVI